MSWTWAARAGTLTVVLLVATVANAYADLTAFIGTAGSPANRPTKGLALGVGLLVVGFEFEFGSADENLVDRTPALRTGMGNVLLQTPVALFGFRPYVTTGAGIYRERLAALQETNIGLNSGAGVKISLAGPLRARVDYRVFKLRGDARYPTVHRTYIGLNLGF